MSVAGLGLEASLWTAYLSTRSLFLYHCHAELSGSYSQMSHACRQNMSVHESQRNRFCTNTVKLLPNHLPTKLPGLVPELAFAVDANASSLYIREKIPLAIDLQGTWGNN